MIQCPGDDITWVQCSAIHLAEVPSRSAWYLIRALLCKSVKLIQAAAMLACPSPCFAASMGSHLSYCNHILMIIFPTGTINPFHECCRSKNNSYSCVFLGSEASNLNCQSCHYCSAPSRRTDGDYCNRINCLKFPQRNKDGESRCVYIQVQILNHLPKRKSKSQWSKDTGETFFLVLNITSRPSLII
jgi:hypothetical protein